MPTQFFDAVLAFHGVVAAAAHIPVLEGMHQLIVTSIKAVLTRVVFVGDHEPLLNKASTSTTTSWPPSRCTIRRRSSTPSTATTKT